MDVAVEYEDDNELFEEIVSEIKRENILTNNEVIVIFCEGHWGTVSRLLGFINIHKN